MEYYVKTLEIGRSLVYGKNKAYILEKYKYGFNIIHIIIKEIELGYPSKSTLLRLESLVTWKTKIRKKNKGSESIEEEEDPIKLIFI